MGVCYWHHLPSVLWQQNEELAQTYLGSVSTVVSRKKCFLGIDQYSLNWKVSYFMPFCIICKRFYLLFCHKMFFVVCVSTAINSKGRFPMEAVRFLSKHGASTTIRYSPSRRHVIMHYNETQYLSINWILKACIGCVFFRINTSDAVLTRHIIRCFCTQHSYMVSVLRIREKWDRIVAIPYCIFIWESNCSFSTRQRVSFRKLIFGVRKLGSTAGHPVILKCYDFNESNHSDIWLPLSWSIRVCMICLG